MLRSILKDLENWAQENKMRVNAKKTKIMIFRNGGKVNEGEEWEINRTKVKVIKEFKYLGYWFTSKNSVWVHGTKRTRASVKSGEYGMGDMEKGNEKCYRG